MSPEILVLDEPAAGLDPKGRDRVMRLIEEYREKTGSTIIIVSHSMQTAASFADRILVLNKGALFFNGTPDELFKKTEEIEQIGLAAPPITRIFHKLIAEGYNLPDNVYNAKEAAKAILNLKRGEGAK